MWPDEKDIRRAPHNASTETSDATRDANGALRLFDCIWIPDEVTDLKLKILVTSHCGCAGHRGMDLTLSIVREDFVWIGMQEDVKEFVKNCLHCKVSRDAKISPRPLSSAPHGSRPNNVVHCDYLYMGPSEVGEKYVLIVRDYLS